MDIYAARQPIFTKEEKVFGYELLHRKTEENRFVGGDQSEATAELVNNAFLGIGIQEYASNRRLFINFSKELLINLVPMMLPKELIVIEILENVDPDPEVIEACREMKAAGYLLALDDFIFREDYEALIQLADIIKVEYGSYTADEHRRLTNKYGKKVLLVERVETREDFEKAVDYGYRLFQGYFFSKPIMMKGKELPPFNPVLLQVVEEIKRDEPRLDFVAHKIESDLSLAYKFLKLANTIQFGSRFYVETVKEAIVRIGLEGVRKWIYIIMLQGVKFSQNSEMITNSLIRAKMMELIAGDLKRHKNSFFLTGLFSELDAITGKSFDALTRELPLSKDVEDALVGRGGEIQEILTCISQFEKGTVELQEKHSHNKYQKLDLEGYYQQSIIWSNKVLGLE